MSANIDALIAKAQKVPLPANGDTDEIVPDIPKAKVAPRPPKPPEDLPKPAEIVTPSGTKLRFVIEPEDSEGEQCWEADDYEQLSGKLFKALVNANIYIRRQKREIAAMHDFAQKVSIYLTKLASAHPYDELLQAMAEILSEQISKR